MKKIKLAIICGGRSAEHEVSLCSAKNIVEAADKNKYEIVILGITKAGEWQLLPVEDFLKNADDPVKISLKKGVEVLLDQNKIVDAKSGKKIGSFDIAFPILHGTFGEDGAIQGLLKINDIPFVGADVLGSAVGMDKVVMKKLLRDAKYPIAKFLSYKVIDRKNVDFNNIRKTLGLPFYVKPANTGSSVGVHKVKSESDFSKYVEDAFKFDNKIIFEQNIDGREIECSVLGNEEPIASLPGEVITEHEFYSYEAKYLDENGSRTEIPAKLPKSIINKIQTLSIEVFKTLECSGMARVDFFLQKNGRIVVNEINTIPGFTKISMYPKLWEASGISYSELIDRLIKLAVDKYKSEKDILTEYRN